MVDCWWCDLLSYCQTRGWIIHTLGLIVRVNGSARGDGYLLLRLEGGDWLEFNQEISLIIKVRLF